MYEHLRNDFSARLSQDYGREDITRIVAILDKIAQDYDISEKTTALALVDTIPKEVKTYLASKRLEGLSEKSLKLYALRLRQFFETVRKPSQEVTTNDVRMYLATYQEQRRISDRSLDKMRQVLCCYFNWLVDEEYINKNPCRTIKAIKYEVIPRKSLTRKQLEMLRRQCTTKRDLAIVDVLFSTACRVSELVNMRLSDLTEDGKAVHIIGKGNKHNIVYLNSNAILSLEDYLQDRKGQGDYLFTSNYRPYNKLTTRTIEALFRQYSETLNVRITPHIIRHTTATLALQSGMEITQVQKMLNHTSVTTTQIYAETSQEDVRQAHERYVV